ncbi:MAG: outer membrane protein assembly factor BamA, partial [Verrucomicrobia bacterium]|nr:outer membrane protein assembly factor BamA [Verrucomicrobiota bacterium]
LAEDYAHVEPCIEIVSDQLIIVLKIWLKPTIREIVYCGNERVSTKKLQKELDVEIGSCYDQEGFLESFNNLRRLYVKKGYFESDLNYEVISHENCNDVTIKITIQEGRAGKIKRIDFCGLKRCEENELLDLMVTKRHNFLLSWYLGSGCYNPEMVEHDQLQIVNYLQNKGYADAVVSICLDDQTLPGCIILKICVDKGQCYHIGEMGMEGNCIFTNPQIWSRFNFGRGSIYSPEKIRETIQSISDLYGAHGYIDASVDIQLSLRNDEPVYDLCLMVEEGEAYRVGIVKVFGNQCTQTNLILHETLLCPGEVFDIRKLKGTEKRLENTGYFKCVNVYAVKSSYEGSCEEDLYRDVYIEVTETDTGNVGLFFGFSSLEQLFGGVEISEQNFNIGGITRIFEKGPRALRGAGEYAHFKVNVGDRQTSYLAQWTKPYFMDTPWIVGVDLEKNDNRVLSQAYEIKTYGGSVHATYIRNEYLKYNFYYRANKTNTSVSGNPNTQLEVQGAEGGLISAAGLNIMYDSTDHPRRPTDGFRSRFIYEIAGLGGTFDFMKFAYLNTYYYPMSKRGTLKFRADLQFILPYSDTTPVDLPLGERFFLGGETTVRGYRPFVIGPLFGNLEPVGGISSMLLSEEYQYNVLKAPAIDAFVFVDAGMVSLSRFTLGRYAASVGFGTRLEVIKNVPLMMGLGWPIHPTVVVNGVTIDNSQRFFFSMGGNF